MRAHWGHIVVLAGLAAGTVSFGQGKLGIITTTLPAGTVTLPYSTSLGASGGKNPLVWTISAGALPGGLALSAAGAITGTPTATGSFQFTALVQDDAKMNDSRQFTLAVNSNPVITTASLPNGVVGASYSTTLTSTGAIAPVTWTVSAGSLPANLTLSTSGVIGGTPSAAGTASFTVKLSDSKGGSDTQSLSITISPAPLASVTTASLPNGTVGTAYSQALTASGGTAPYSWTLVSGTLPAGLTLSTGGTIAGTPTGAGSSTFTVRATDSASRTATGSLTVVIDAATLTVTTASLPNGTVGNAYSQAVAASGGTPPYTWTLASGTLPAGLTLSTGGTIAGTPTGAGSSTFTVRATDSASRTATGSLTVVINAATLTVTTASLPNGTVGVAYSQAVAASGGTPPYTWTLASGTLPAGLTLSTGGTIAGTPTGAGSSTFTVRATDSASRTATGSLTVVINAATLTVTTASLPNGTVGVAYSQAVAASGGTPPYTWTLASGTLPAGLTLSTGGTIAGTPTGAGSSTFTVRATDSASRTATGSLTVVINAATLTVTTASLPNGTVGVAYSQAVAASGGTPPYTWTLASGTLPAGLTLSTGGTIAGTPTSAGSSTFTVRATDSASQTATGSLTLVINVATLTVTTASLPSGTVGVAYSQAVAASGGTPPYTWTRASGTLPAGLTLSTGGTIAGTPTGAGSSTFTVRATDSASQTATGSLTVVINPPTLTVTTASLPNGTVGVAYSQAVAASGGTPPYTWTLASGTLPAGLTLSTGGTIAGTPTGAGSSTFTVRATDSASRTATGSLTVVINVATLTVTTASLPNGTVGVAYSQAVAASGGTPPYTWTLASGTLPAGLTLSTGGTIGGTPTGAGSSTFTVRATDSASQTATGSLTVVVSPATLTVTTASLPSGTVGVAYSQAVAASGGTPPYTWTLASGTLPAGVTLSSGGTIAGTPTGTGSSTFTVRATDSASQTATGSLTVVINAATLIVTTASLPSGTVGVAYSQPVAASGGTPPYTWTLASGTLPAGLTLSAGGTIAGNPTDAGSSTFTVRATDSASQTATGSLTVVINAATLTVTTASLPNGTVGVAYSQAVAASGGTPPYTWTLASGTLPAGLTLSTSGTIAGTPTAAGSSTFSVRTTDGASQTATASLTVVINAATLTVTTASLPNGTVGVAYSQVVAASGGTPPYTWTLASGTLPAGLTLSTGGTIAGTPTAAGSSTFSVRATDGTSQTATASLTVVINAATLTVTTASLPNGTVGVAYSQAVAASGGTPPYTWTLASGTLPAGLTLSTGGTIAGTPTAAGSSTFSVRATDGASQTATGSLTVVINAATLTVTTASVPSGTVGVAYSQAVAASGGTPPYTWTLASGTLPAGLTLSAGGTIAGNPTAAGSSTFSVRATDSASQTATASLTVVINAPTLTVTTASLPNGTVGVAYSQAVAASGGTPPYTWALASGTSPAGLTLSAGGIIAGTPTGAGSSTFSVRATDGASQTATASLTVVINAATLTVTPSSLPNGTVGTPYSQTLSAAGGTAPYTWLTTGGTLPAGLTLSTGGTISGTPLVAGNFAFSLRVADSLGNQMTFGASIQIARAPIQITTSSLPQSTAGANYAQTLSATGGVLPLSWTVSTGSLPPGLALDSGGAIAGVSRAPGTYTFSVEVVDSTGAKANLPYVLTINAAISIETASLADALIGAPYTQQLRAAGGTPPYTWSLRSGGLPDGVTLDAATGAIRGTPAAVGSFTFTLRATDGVSAFAEKEFQITTAAGLIITTAPVLPPGTAGLQYDQILVAAGGRAPYLWSISSGGLPAGLTLNTSTGALSGVPSVAGSFQFTADVSDSLARKASKQFRISVAAPLVISSAPDLPPATTGVPYSQSITITGGSTPYVLSIISGGLPAGLSFDAGTSTVSGTPTQGGTFTFTIQVVDNNSVTTTKQFTVTVTSNLVITTSSPLPDAIVGSPYTSSLGASGGVAPYSWTVKSGSLPPDLAVDARLNAIAGTPTASGVFNFTLVVTDAGGGTATRDFRLAVGLPPLPSVSIDGLADPAKAADQPTFTVSLATAYPVQVTGQIVMTFSPDAAIALDDPSIQFSTGGRTASFTIPAGSTTAVFSTNSMALQTGTVAGTINLALSLQSAKGEVDTTASRALHVLRAVPVARSLEVVRTSGGFDLHVTGYSTPLQLTQAVVQLTPTAGSTLQSTELTIPLTDLAASWYRSSTAAPFGSQFMLTLPFTVQGNTAGIDSASVRLVNSEGTSASATAKF